ncbi:MAG: lysylphosphatidylglycerol synthase transmembrane domain-containing protein [Planctomycetota bacterium]|nr:lysylphosphatidylglycerol synthase transmembrane domain-containing protein [Planctomycetota bacterium]
MKKHLVLFLQFGIPLAIIAYLLYQVDQHHPGQFQRLWHQPKNWPLLSVGFGLVFISVGFSFLRWWVLVRALGLSFRLTEAVRLSFLGYLLSFIAPGSVGGDLFKAVFIARQQPGRRTEAVATVLLDRVIGIYVLFVVASGTILLSGISRSRTGMAVKAVCDFTLLVTAISTVAALLMLFVPFQNWRLFVRLCRLPKVGPVLGRLASALHVYRRNLRAVVLALALSLVVHAVFPVSLYLVAQSFYTHPPTITEHFVIVPLSLSVGAIPTPGGLGTFELAMDQLYKLLAPETNAEGIIVALTYRLMTLVIAAIGVIYYVTSRREVQSLLEEAEAEQRREPPIGNAEGL